MALFDLMGSIFKGLMDPTALARQMAQMNVSPEELMQQMQKTQQIQTMPTAGAQTTPGGQNSDSSIFGQGGMLELPSQAGRNRDLNSVDNTMMNFFKMLSGQQGTGSNASEQQQQGTPIPSGGMSKTPNALSNLMQPSTAATPPVTPTQAGLAMQPLPPMPAQLQGLPAQLMSAGSSVPPPNVPQQAMPGAPQMPLPPQDNLGGNPTLGGLMQPPQVRSTMTPQAPAHGRAGEMESRAMPGDIRAAISQAAQKYGQDPNTLMRIAMVESSGNPRAHNKSGAAGLFQFMPGTAKEYGLTDPYDPVASADAAARLLRDNRETLTAQLGREPTAGELYLAHQQGSGGAGKLLSNPDAKAADMVGAKAVTANGGTANMTSQQFANKWISKIDNFGDVPEAGNLAPQQGPPLSAKTPIVPPVDPTAATSAAPKDYTKGPFGFLDALNKSDSSGGQEDLNLPNPPPPVAPQPGRYDVNPQAMMAMLQMLGPMAGGAQIPSLMQLMSGR